MRDDAGSPSRSDAQPPRLAYLVNRYPAVSHSFIRREILAIEATGEAVERFSIRPDGPVSDPADRAEMALTTVILGQGALRLLAATLVIALSRPRAFLNALGVTLSMAGGAPGRIVRHLAYLVEACWLTRRLEAHGIAHLHAHFGTNPAAVARLVRRLGGPPYSFTIHGPKEFDEPQALDLGGKIADAKMVATISHFGRSQAMRWSAPRFWPKIKVVRCGVDDAFLAQGTDSAPPPLAPRLCAVCRLSAQKGLPLLIEAAAILAARGMDFHITICGDGELRGAIEAAIATHGLGDKVTLAGNCDAATVRRHLLESRAFVLPSFGEGLPVVIMEALALERPVIASAIAGTPELVDARCGWLIPAGAVEPLVDAMTAALTAPPETLARMGAEGRARVLAAHDARRNGPELLAHLGALSPDEDGKAA